MTKSHKQIFAVEYRCQALCAGILTFEATDQKEAERLATEKLRTVVDADYVQDRPSILTVSRVRASSPVVPISSESKKKRTKST